MKKATIFLILFSIIGFITAQSSDNQMPTIKTVKGSSLSVDLNGNVYVIDGSLLYKFDSEGILLHKYSNFLLGDITAIDIDNPLKIMLFYQNEAQILFLDKNLNPLMEPLDLYANDYKNILLATYSTDNTIWLYDGVMQDLINVNFQLKELSRNHLAFENFTPTQLFSRKEKQLIMYVPASGVVFFDAYGTYVKTIVLPTDCMHIQIGARDTYISYTVPTINSTDKEVLTSHLMNYDYAAMEAHKICNLENAAPDIAPVYTTNSAGGINDIWYIDKDFRIQKTEFIY